METTGTLSFLYGISMGAAAVVRAVSHYHLDPDAIVVECPFGAAMPDRVAE